MTASLVAEIISDDCLVLFTRALTGKTVCAFGEDGLGQFGTSSYPLWFDVDRVDVELEYIDDHGAFLLERCLLRVNLKNYDSRVTGHIMTDQNFLISVREHLKEAEIHPEALEWPADLGTQGETFVALTINLDKVVL